MVCSHYNFSVIAKIFKVRDFICSMRLKEFFKPNKAKIVLTIVLMMLWLTIFYGDNFYRYLDPTTHAMEDRFKPLQIITGIIFFPFALISFFFAGGGLFAGFFRGGGRSDWLILYVIALVYSYIISSIICNILNFVYRKYKN